MGPRRRTVLMMAAVLVAGAALLGWKLTAGSRLQTIEAGFWFEDVSFASPRLPGPLSGRDLARIREVAAAELAHAFRRLRIRFSDARDARYRIRVVQDVRDARFRRPVHVAGQSWGMSGFGGGGAVSFELLASGAVVYAPPDMDRAGIIDAIGRGIGRAAVHEFAHQLFPRAALHAMPDRSTYEFYSAGREEQYFGQLRWGLAGPWLQARLAAP